MNNSEVVILFLHIPKTGGASLADVFEQNFGPWGSDVYFNANDWSNLNSEKMKRARVVHGHFPYGIHNYINRDYKYITIIRHPADRIASLYSYIMGFTDDGIAHWQQSYPSLYRGMPIEKFIELPMPTMSNGMSKQIYGESKYIQFGSDFSISEFNEVLEHLDEFLVGVVDYYEDSIRAICSYFQLKIDFVPHNNKSGERQADIRQQVRCNRIFLAMNEFDIELHRIALEKADRFINGP